MRSQSKHSHGHLLVHVDVEHYRVVVCLIGKEGCDRCKYNGRYRKSVPHGPLVVACHFLSSTVKYVVHNEHQHRYDYRHTKSSLAYDGTKRCSDKEEYDTGKGQCELKYGLYLVGTVISVHAVGKGAFHLQVGGARLSIV